MKLSTKGRYAVMALVDMAQQGHSHPVSLADIAHRQHLPLSYLEQLFAKLRKAQLVTSIRGQQGGYCLTLPAESISVLDVLQAADEPLKATLCLPDTPGGCLGRSTKCLTHHVWAGLDHHMTDYLRQTSLADVLCPQTPSSKTSVYCDYNATFPLRPSVQKVMKNAMTQMGNASSQHTWGRTQRQALEQSRRQIALGLDCPPDFVIFTSGGTESNNMVMHSFAPHVLASQAEHACIRHYLQPDKVIRMTPEGLIDLVHLEQLLQKSSPPALVSVMLVNNETGVIQPLTEVVSLAKRYGAFVHTDAVQALGRIPVSFQKLGVDAMTVSSHKVGGPMGIGALIVRPGLSLTPLLRGGGQEKGYRPGTTPVVLALGFAQALEEALKEDWSSTHALRQQFEETLQSLDPAIAIYGQTAPRVPNTTAIRMPGVRHETQLVGFDLEGIAVSAGAACSSGKAEPSWVLRSMGVADDDAQETIRFSFGPHLTSQDIQYIVLQWKTLYQRHQALGAPHAA
jgi:cysteine desulfurase